MGIWDTITGWVDVPVTAVQSRMLLELLRDQHVAIKVFWKEFVDPMQRALLDSDFDALKYNWRYMRMTIPLRHRLLIEQVMSDLGGRFAQFVTGFNPILATSPEALSLAQEQQETNAFSQSSTSSKESSQPTRRYGLYSSRNVPRWFR